MSHPVRSIAFVMSIGSAPCPLHLLAIREIHVDSRGRLGLTISILSRKSKFTFTACRCCSYGLSYLIMLVQLRHSCEAQSMHDENTHSQDERLILVFLIGLQLRQSASWNTWHHGAPTPWGNSKLADSYSSIYAQPWPCFPPANAKGYQGSLPST